jgi:hypothetical protein
LAEAGVLEEAGVLAEVAGVLEEVVGVLEEAEVTMVGVTMVVAIGPTTVLGWD